MIGFIDSGVGGLNVLIETYKLFNDDFVYLCDNKNAPYGNKSPKKLIKITRQNIDYLIKQFDVDIIVLACNTLSFCVYEEIVKEYKIKIIPLEFDEKCLDRLNKPVLFFATHNTIKHNKIIQKNIKNNNALSLSIKNLPKKIDDNLFNLESIEKILNRHFKSKKMKEIKSVVLGCTHYLTIKNMLKKYFCDDVVFYDNVYNLANKLKGIVVAKNSKSFHIVLTNYDYPKYVEFKTYVYRNLRDRLT